MTNRYRLRSGPTVCISGPLALIAPQALEAAAAGREALVSGPDGNTVAITTPTPSTFAVAPYGPLQLFAATSSEPPAWATRLAGLINQMHNTGETP